MSHRRVRRASARGFTLVELLVVIGIIALLAGIAIPVMGSMKTRAKANATKMLIERLKLALEEYNSRFGDYPPSSPKAVGLPSTGTDDGIKSLVRCLSTKAKGTEPCFTFDEESLKKDESGVSVKGNPTGSYFATKDLFVLVDAFGQPLIYLHNADYDRGQKVGLLEGTVQVSGNRSKKLNQFHALTKFQLWSAGPDGKNDGGENDDVTSWGGSE